MRAGLLAAVLACALWAAGALSPLEEWAVDTRFEVRGEQPVPEVAVVDLDSETLSTLEEWPIRRSRHARVIDRLRRAGARSIAYDVQFSEPTEPAEDNALLDALTRAPGTVLATTEAEAGEHDVLGGEETVRAVGAEAANALFGTDRGAVIRRVPDEVDGLGSFAVVAARQILGRRYVPSGAGREGAWIDYAGPPGTVPTVSFGRILRDPRAADALRGRIVVVGSSAPSLQDVHPTSTSGSGVMSGPEIQANAIATALRGFPLRSAPGWTGALAALLGAMAAGLAFARLRPLPALTVAAALIFAWLGAVQLAFAGGWMLHAVAPLVAILLASLAGLGLRLGAEARERRRVRGLFARFVPEAVVDQVLATTGDDLRLGGVRQQATVLFCDLRGFTAYAESVAAERVIEVLNRYLSEMSEAILDHGGTLVTYLGDGIMAVFGSPLERPDHADAALAAAREMLDVRLERFNARLAEEGADVRFRMGVGLCSGAVMSGNVGSERRLEYAAIGDTTNVAARLQAATKGTPHALYVADATRRALVDPRAAGTLEEVGEVALSGRREPVRVWTSTDDPYTDAASGRSPGAWTSASAHAR